MIVVRINHFKKFAEVEIDNKFNNLIANPKFNLINNLKLKLNDIFFHHYTLNLL